MYRINDEVTAEQRKSAVDTLKGMARTLDLVGNMADTHMRDGGCGCCSELVSMGGGGLTIEERTEIATVWVEAIAMWALTGERPKGEP